MRGTDEQKAVDYRFGAPELSEIDYKVCAATCLLIASKSFERDDDVP